MTESGRYVQILIDTLQKQVDVLGEVLNLTREQSKIADDDEFDEVMLEKTLNRKEILISQLNELDAGFVSVYSRVRQEVREHQQIYVQELRRLKSLIQECTDLGVEIKVLEERNRDKMSKRFAGRQKEYGAQRTAANVASRYHQTMRNAQAMESYFFNQKK